MKKLLLGSFLAALGVFFLGAAFWMSPPTMKIFNSPTQEDVFAKNLLDHLPTSGVYLYPGTAGTAEQRETASQKGPNAIIHFQRDGMPALDPAQLVRGFLVVWVTMALLALLLQLAAPALPTYGSRVLLTIIAGLIVAANSDLGATVWWHHSAPFAATSAFYNVISFTLGGLILGKFVHRN